jgi:hypothetical protein
MRFFSIIISMNATTLGWGALTADWLLKIQKTPCPPSLGEALMQGSFEYNMILIIQR